MTNLEKYYPGTMNENKLAQALEKECMFSESCDWCYAHRNGSCAAGRFREWLDMEVNADFRCFSCEVTV